MSKEQDEKKINPFCKEIIQKEKLEYIIKEIQISLIINQHVRFIHRTKKDITLRLTRASIRISYDMYLQLSKYLIDAGYKKTDSIDEDDWKIITFS